MKLNFNVKRLNFNVKRTKIVSKNPQHNLIPMKENNPCYLLFSWLQITFPWAEQQVQNVQNVQSVFDSISSLYTLASQSPQGEITLNLIAMPSPDSEAITCGSV